VRRLRGFLAAFAPQLASLRVRRSALTPFGAGLLAGLHNAVLILPPAINRTI
jgi:hypothetical protein